MKPFPTRAFASRRAIASLNVLAVGSALACCTSAAFSLGSGDVQFAACISTFVVGTIWAASLRRRRPRSGRRTGWWLSPLFACANSMLCLAIVGFVEQPARPLLDVLGMVIFGGAIVGAVIWIPALVLTLLFFGWPIAHAQRLAERGLAGAERGEIIVGVSSALLASLGLLVASKSIGSVFACVAITTGLAAATISAFREHRRRAFVRRVEAGTVPHFRVDATSEGKVLVRVTSTGGAYRVTDLTEEIATLSTNGEVVGYSGTT